MVQPQPPGHKDLLQVQHSEGVLELELTGEWHALRFGEIDAGLAAVGLGGVRPIEISPERLEALDLSGAWRLHEFVRVARCAPILVNFKGEPPDQLRLVEKTMQGQSPPCSQQQPKVPLRLIDEIELPAVRSLTVLGQ